MKLIAPGHADSYEEQPFPPSYTAGIAPFSNIRFMDRGQTNATEDRIANFDGIVTAIETEDVEAFFGRLLD